MNKFIFISCVTLICNVVSLYGNEPVLASKSVAPLAKTASVNSMSPVRGDMAYVDFSQIATKSLLAQELMKSLEKELQERAMAIQNMYQSYEKKRGEFEKSHTALSFEAKEERKKDLMQLEHKIKIEESAFQEVAQRRRQEVEQQLFEEVLKTVRVYAEKHHVQGVANAAMMLYVDQKYVITEEIIDQMNKEYEAKRTKTVAVEKK